MKNNVFNFFQNIFTENAINYLSLALNRRKTFKIEKEIKMYRNTAEL